MRRMAVITGNRFLIYSLFQACRFFAKKKHLFDNRSSAFNQLLDALEVFGEPDPTKHARAFVACCTSKLIHYNTPKIGTHEFVTPEITIAIQRAPGENFLITFSDWDSPEDQEALVLTLKRYPFTKLKIMFQPVDGEKFMTEMDFDRILLILRGRRHRMIA